MLRLTSSGSPTFNSNSTCTIDSTGSDIVSAPAALISNSQCWVAVRVNVNFANTADPYAGGDIRMFEYSNAADEADLLGLFFLVGTDNWVARRTVANVAGDALSGAQTFSADTDFTLIFAADANNVKLSVNGGAFVSTAKTAGSISGTTFQIGNRSDGTRAANSDFYWVAGGKGTLADADASTLDGFGNTDPSFAALPGFATFLWTCDNINYHNGQSDPQHLHVPFQAQGRNL